MAKSGIRKNLIFCIGNLDNEKESQLEQHNSRNVCIDLNTLCSETVNLSR